MASIRLDTSDDPDRHKRVTEKLKQAGSNASVYGRALFDALMMFHEKHGRFPRIDRIEIAETPEKPEKGKK